ncbi:FAD:protein FMN transferase [Jatrophihabitans sp. DSM 45814]
MTRHTATSINLTSWPWTGRRIEHCMGTVFSFDVRAPGCDPTAVDNAIEWLHWVDETFSTYKPDSQISRLARGELEVTDCAPEVGEILARCVELDVETDGYFSAYASGRLDPSGLVKGWAIQHTSDLLSRAGSRNHCVNGGGDVHCTGTANGGEPWRVGITDPLRTGQLAAVVVGADLAVATSGNAERGAHIVNPRDHTSVSTLASVTIVGKDLAYADAYATAAFAMGDQAPDWITTLNGYQGLVIRADGSRWESPTFAIAS